MPCQARRDDGFAMLECLVSTLILTMLAIGLARLTTAHQRLMADLGTWCALEPEYYLVPSSNELERIVGLPARLTREIPLPAPPPHDRGSDRYDVVVLLRERRLGPQRASATVEMIER